MQHDSYSPSENFVNQHMNSYRKSHLPAYIVDIIVKLMFCGDLPEKSVHHKGGWTNSFLLII
jgi:hypothetical protein